MLGASLAWEVRAPLGPRLLLRQFQVFGLMRRLLRDDSPYRDFFLSPSLHRARLSFSSRASLHASSSEEKSSSSPTELGQRQIEFASGTVCELVLAKRHSGWRYNSLVCCSKARAANLKAPASSSRIRVLDPHPLGAGPGARHSLCRRERAVVPRPAVVVVVAAPYPPDVVVVPLSRVSNPWPEFLLEIEGRVARWSCSLPFPT